MAVPITTKKQNAWVLIGLDAVDFFILAIVSFGIALVINQVRHHPVPLIYEMKEQRLQVVTAVSGGGERGTQAQFTSKNPRVVELAEFRRLVEAKSALIFDARPEIFYRMAHVPGALSLPREDFDNAYANNKSLLEANKAQTIAVYCAGFDCSDSGTVAVSLVSLGYQHVLVFKDGWEAWTDANLPKETKP